MTSASIKTTDRLRDTRTERSPQVLHDPRLNDVSPSNISIEMNTMGTAVPENLDNVPQAKTGHTIRSRPAAQAEAGSPPSGGIRLSNEDGSSNTGNTQAVEPFTMTLAQERGFLATLCWAHFLIGWNDSTLGPVSLHVFNLQGSRKKLTNDFPCIVNTKNTRVL